ncbi:MAG: M20/M25/M40 family metallo-hydrolase [Saprospiraceae bacterium]
MRKILFQTLLLFPFFLFSQNNISSLTGALLSETPLEEDLQELCDNIGGRVTGSEANKKSVQWAYDKFVAAGINVKRDAFTMPSLWLPKSTTLTIKGSAFKPQVVSKSHSPKGVSIGELIYIGTGSKAELDAVGSTKIKGKFLLVEMDICFDINGLFAEYAHAASVEFEAIERGAKGIVFMSSRPNKLLYRFISSKAVDNDMPQLVMAREDAQRCIRILDSGETMHIRIEIDAETGGSFESHNVIGEIRGSEKPDEIIVIGAHLDSWDLGTGANDNGANVCMMIDIARQMKKRGIQPKRTIRFALWNGEEQGYYGSWDYTKEHLKKLDDHKMALSVDIGSGAIIGFFTNGRSELLPILDKVLKPVAGLGSYSHIDAPVVGTDNFDFMLQGVPNLVAVHKPQFYGSTYHSSSDTFDKVDLKQLKMNSAIVAALTLGFANLSEAEAAVLGRQSRPEIQNIFDKNNLEFTMRMFNVWDVWVNKERGRK